MINIESHLWCGRWRDRALFSLSQSNHDAATVSNGRATLPAPKRLRDFRCLPAPMRTHTASLTVGIPSLVVFLGLAMLVIISHQRNTISNDTWQSFRTDMQENLGADVHDLATFDHDGNAKKVEAGPSLNRNSQDQSVYRISDEQGIMTSKKPPIQYKKKPQIPSPRTKLLGNRIVYYLHIHKTGGSTLCHSAFVNHLKVKRSQNCNVQHDQHCCGEADTLAASTRFFETSFYTFVANEAEMYETMDTTRYFYVVTMRHAQTRYLSHWNHVQQLYKKDDMPGFAHWWKQQPDNYSTRMICGPSCLKTPKFGITPNQFDKTLARLSQFEGFLFVEDYEQSFTKLQQQLGWTTVGKKEQVAGNHYLDNKSTVEGSDFDPAMGVLDEAIYEFAMMKYLGNPNPALSDETLSTLDLYFEDVAHRHCRDPCCGECSQKF